MTTLPIRYLLVRQSPRTWKQIMAVFDGGIVHFEFEPAALFGWNLRSVETRTIEDWPNMTADQIVSWKRHNGIADGYDYEPTSTDIEWVQSQGLKLSLEHRKAA